MEKVFFNNWFERERFIDSPLAHHADRVNDKLLASLCMFLCLVNECTQFRRGITVEGVCCAVSLVGNFCFMPIFWLIS